MRVKKSLLVSVRSSACLQLHHHLRNGGASLSTAANSATSSGVNPGSDNSAAASSNNSLNHNSNPLDTQSEVASKAVKGEHFKKPYSVKINPREQNRTKYISPNYQGRRNPIQYDAKKSTVPFVKPVLTVEDTAAMINAAKKAIIEGFRDGDPTIVIEAYIKVRYIRANFLGLQTFTSSNYPFCRTCARKLYCEDSFHHAISDMQKSTSICTKQSPEYTNKRTMINFALTL